MTRLAFVILHYLDFDDTIECVNSIKRIELSKSEKVEIIVVDNGSYNDSWTKIKEILGSDIIPLSNKKNLGFAQGNNVGYLFAKYQLNADYIVVLNSDTIIVDPLFVKKIVSNFSEYKYAVLGPNLITVNNKIQQNPLDIVFDEIKVKRQIWNSMLMYCLEALYINKLRRKIRKGKSEAVASHNDYRSNQFDVPLHGACLIYSPIYLERMDFAFYPKTFLYMEENILFYLCSKFSLRTMFDCTMDILHKEDVSSSLMLKNNDRKKMMFVFRNQIKSSAAFYELIKRRFSIKEINDYMKGFADENKEIKDF